MPVPTYDGGYRYDEGWFYDRADQPLPPGVVSERKKMARIKLDIYNLGIAELILYLKAIIAKMKTNPTFASILAKVTALETAVTALEAKVATVKAAEKSLQEAQVEVGNGRATTEEAARALATATEDVTLDATELLNGGWDLRAEGTPVGPMPAPLDAAASAGDLEGEADFQWGAIKRGVQVYLAEHATAPSGPWTQFYVGRASKCTATGLVSGTQYWFRARAVGAAGPGPWSDPATCRAA